MGYFCPTFVKMVPWNGISYYSYTVSSIASLALLNAFDPIELRDELRRSVGEDMLLHFRETGEVAVIVSLSSEDLRLMSSISNDGAAADRDCCKMSMLNKQWLRLEAEFESVARLLRREMASCISLNTACSEVIYRMINDGSRTLSPIITALSGGGGWSGLPPNRSRIFSL